MQEDEICVNEKIGSYFECVPVGLRKLWFAETLHNTRNLGIDTMGDWAIEKLSTAKGGWRVIKNAPNYEILSNMKYVQAFQFVPIDMTDLAQEVEISDTLLKVLYMPYLKEGYTKIDFKRPMPTRMQKIADRKKKKAAVALRAMKQKNASNSAPADNTA